MLNYTGLCWTIEFLNSRALYVFLCFPMVVCRSRVAYGQVMLVDANRRSLFVIGEPWEKIKKRFRQMMVIPHPGAMHRNSLFHQRGVFDDTFRIAADYEFLLRELKENNASFISNFIVVGMMQGGISSDPANSLLSMREMRRAQKMHGQYSPGFFWLLVMIRVYIRLLLWKWIGERNTKKLLDLGRRIKGQTQYWTRI